MSDKILKLDQAQTLYQDLRGRIDALPTSEDITVTDVQVNGTSVVTDGVANVPISASGQLGVIKPSWGTQVSAEGLLSLTFANSVHIKAGTDTARPVAAGSMSGATFYGLAKAAGADMKDIANTTVGIYPDAQKAAIQNMLGVTDLISTEETTTATAAHALNSLFLMGGKLYKATVAIAIGDAVVEGENCEVTNVSEAFPHDVQINNRSIINNGVAVIPIASSGDRGVMRLVDQFGIRMGNNDIAVINNANYEDIKAGTNLFKPIVPQTQHSSVFYGLAKAAGDTTQSQSSNAIGTYTDDAKSAIRTMLGAAAASDVTVSDVQVNGASVLSNGTATIPVASSDTLGVVKVGSGLTINSSNVLLTDYATAADSKSGTNYRKPITPYAQDAAAFYGLAKAAGDTTQAASSNAVGTYTESAKASIRTMLGAASTNIVAVQDEQPTDTDTKVWLSGTQATGVQVPTMEDMQNYVQKTDYATTDDYGLVKVGSGLYIGASTGKLAVAYANSSSIKNGTNATASAPVSLQHESAFYGLAKAAGDATQVASDNAVGTYTSDASVAIRSMLGAVGDVQVNGTSVISNGVANVPLASSDNAGVVKIHYIGSQASYGIGISNGEIFVSEAALAHIKGGTTSYRPIVPARQHESAFYGLAKAAGDTTQSASSNAVGTYTAEAKSAIQSMLGIDLQSIASEVEIPLVETVSGTTPSITGQPNTRYVCGEVSTLSITPPSAGSIDVIFDSGSTAAVITVPNTVRWPAWFDATALEADTTYEILITDGVYGSVMTWAN